MFPKCVSGTTGELRENKGCDMETPREMFFDATWISQDNREALQWGQGRIQYLEEQAKVMLGARSEKEEEIASLESHARDMGELLEQREQELANLKSHLHERNATIDELEDEIKLFPKSVSGTTGELRENKGCDMADASDFQLRQRFFYGPVIAINGQAIEWAKKRIEHLEYLEKHASEMAEFLEQIEKKIADLESHLQERDETIDELEAKIKLSQAAASGTSEKSRENKGDDMGDMTAAKITGHRMIFEDVVLHLKNGIHIDLRATSDDAASIIWASERINELEMANKKQGDEMTETSDEALQQKLFKRLNDLAAHKPTNLESDEDRHQRHRSERMLDEVTTSLIRNGLHATNCTMDEFGCGIRHSARKICDGINQADAKH